MKTLFTTIAMCLPIQCFAQGTVDITVDNCDDVFTGDAIEVCIEIASQSDVFTIRDFNKDTDVDPFYVRILTKPDIDGKGVRYESTAWDGTPDAALTKAANILDLIKRGEW